MTTQPAASRSQEGRAAAVRRAALLMAFLAAAWPLTFPTPAGAQKPPAPPPESEDILDEIEPDTPEEVASRDLEQLGEAATREQAAKRLVQAWEALQLHTPNLPTYRSDRPAIQRLRDAVRYYARAHGLNSDVGELIDEYETTEGLRQTFGNDGKRPWTDAEAEKRWGKGWAHFWTAIWRLQQVKVNEATTPSPRPIGQANPPEGGAGSSKTAKVAIGVGAGAVALAALVAVAGGSDSSPSASPTPPAPLTQPPAPLSPAGTYDLNLTVVSDPASNARRISMEPSLWINVTLSGSGMQYTCQPGTHINPGGGPIDLTTGEFNAAGSGVFAGRAGVQFQFPGTFARDGTLTGEYRVSTDRELGGVTTYAVSGRMRR